MTNLIEEHQLSAADGVLARWGAAPVIVRLYFVFSLVAVALLLSIVYSKELDEWLIQWTGWSGLFCYGLGAMQVGQRVLSGSKDGSRRLPILMAAFAGFGLFEYFMHLGEADRFTNTNPYLRIHPWRPLVTVAVPAVWALLLFVPANCRRWMAGADSEGDA